MFELIKDSFKSLCYYLYLRSGFFAKRSVGVIEPSWDQRIKCAVSCPDNQKIKRHPLAGRLKGSVLTMHNGVRICANGYYGSGILNLIMMNKGVHEPQEEFAFDEVIKFLPDKCTMLELGAYWCFYSLSLLKERPAAKCFLVEPELFNLTSGRINFKLNNCKGKFTRAFVGSSSFLRPLTISVDDFMVSNKINRLDILHSDIQGFESEMLQGAHHALSNGLIDFIFISTHSDQLHQECISSILSYDYEILCSASMSESYSHDGLIVARHNSIHSPVSIDISKRQ